jgi:hypothetical protein
MFTTCRYGNKSNYPFVMDTEAHTVHDMSSSLWRQGREVPLSGVARDRLVSFHNFLNFGQAQDGDDDDDEAEVYCAQ